MKRAVLALAFLVAGPALPPAAADSLPEPQVSRFSGKPVPRFETLRFGKVNGRTGPHRDYKVAWEYARKGLPVLILKESGDWRYVQDPVGDEVWIEKNQLTGPGNALTRSAFILKAGRASDSADVAEIGPNVLVGLGTCDESMCQVTADRFRGWAPREQLWGASATKG